MLPLMGGKAERKSFKQSIAIQSFILICRFAQTAIIGFILSGEKYRAILLCYEATIKEFIAIKYEKIYQAVNENILKCFFLNFVMFLVFFSILNCIIITVSVHSVLCVYN